MAEWTKSPPYGGDGSSSEGIFGEGVLIHGTKPVSGPTSVIRKLFLIEWSVQGCGQEPSLP